MIYIEVNIALKWFQLHSLMKKKKTTKTGLAQAAALKTSRLWRVPSSVLAETVLHLPRGRFLHLSLSCN